MSVLTSLGILLFASFACAFLQLTPSVFTIFYHYASAKRSRDKALDFSSYFIIGAEFMAAIVMILLYFVLSEILLTMDESALKIARYVLAGILGALGIFVLLFYYRRGEGTELFISRKMARALTLQAKNVKKPSDAFLLGLSVGTLEIIFTLPIYIIAVFEIQNFPSKIALQPLLTFIFIFISVIPSMSIRGQFYRLHRNFAEIMRGRVRQKTFNRIMLGASYILLAVLLICFRIF
jgi:hypothetical protein